MISLEETIKVFGSSAGDWSVGIPSCDFEIDTGLLELSDEDKDFIRDNIIRAIWELHDNGTIDYYFSDDEKTRRFNLCCLI